MGSFPETYTDPHILLHSYIALVCASGVGKVSYVMCVERLICFFLIYKW